MSLENLFLSNYFNEWVTYSNAEKHRIGGEVRRSRSRSRSRRARATRKLKARVEELEGDLGYLALVVAALLDRLDARGEVTRGEVQGLISKLDMLDGKGDGRIDISSLRDFGTPTEAREFESLEPLGDGTLGSP